MHALEKKGELVTEKVFIGKRVRKYYTLTKSGKISVEEKVTEFSEFMKTMQVLLGTNTNAKNV